MAPRRRLVPLIALLALAACGGSKSASSSSTGALSDDELAKLAPEEQYAVASDLLATIYQGVPVGSFLDLSAGLEAPVVGGGKKFLESTRKALETPLADRQAVLDALAEKYDFDESTQALAYPLAMMWELPLSRDAFDSWMAYTLGTTILFSPATELDTVQYSDAQKVLYRLTRAISQDQSIQQIVYDHVISQENWRRFRSPEDNTREMLEIFLDRFADAEVPLAAAACRNWHLSSEDEGDQLLIEYDENLTPQPVLDGEVVGCFDFYSKLSRHTALIPTITAALVSRFFPDATADAQAQLAAEFAATRPTTFRQLFTTILFSRAYLLQSSRVRSAEETFFGVAHRIGWVPDRNFFRYFAQPPTLYSPRETLTQMRQAPLYYKLGRREIPLDSLSFATYHRSIRWRLLLDVKDTTKDTDAGWPPALYSAASLEGDEFLHYLFLSVVGRRASDAELTGLNAVLKARGYADDAKKRERTFVVLDYLSRLAELYAAAPHP